MKHVSETSQQPENSQPVAKATAGTAGTAEPAKKLTKKEKRRRAQRKQLLTVLAIAAVAAVIIGAVFAYTKWQDNRVAAPGSADHCSGQRGRNRVGAVPRLRAG